jgi:peptidoglycan/xylan/chitin deacetylase (PgdA/CDA1 family)
MVIWWAVGMAGCAAQPSAPAPAPAATPTPADPLPGTRLDLDTLRSQFFHVSAGRRLRPRAWPDGNRVAVALSFDVDNASAALSRGDLGSETLSRGEYGAADGLPRLLRMLDRQAVPASFFVPAVSAALHPTMIAQIQASGRHEIGVHGWIHEHLPTLDDAEAEQRLLRQSIEFLTRATGHRPVGYRAPSWAFSRHTMQQVVEEGFLYDSSLMASDDAYEVLLDGRPTGVVELPIERILDDFPYYGGAASGSLPSTRLVFEEFLAEFEVAYEERGLFVLTMHPHVVGHRARTAALERLIVAMKARPGVWFATHEQVARYVKEHPGSDDEPW